MDSITKHMKNWRLILTLEKKVEIILLNTVRDDFLSVLEIFWSLKLSLTVLSKIKLNWVLPTEHVQTKAPSN